MGAGREVRWAEEASAGPLLIRPSAETPQTTVPEGGVGRTAAEADRACERLSPRPSRTPLQAGSPARRPRPRGGSLHTRFLSLTIFVTHLHSAHVTVRVQHTTHAAAECLLIDCVSARAHSQPSTVLCGCGRVGGSAPMRPMLSGGSCGLKAQIKPVLGVCFALESVWSRHRFFNYILKVFEYIKVGRRDEAGRTPVWSLFTVGGFRCFADSGRCSQKGFPHITVWQSGVCFIIGQ